jgi:NAD(P)-dependent dehydrogenase (short-subunit alcohol dehydrogenase family)
MRLKDKVAIVVGAGMHKDQTRDGQPVRTGNIGNGNAAAILFARAGAKVLLVDYREDRLEDVARTIKEEGGEAATYIADITKEADCAGLVKACVDRFGRVDILQNNVGVAPPSGFPDATVDNINADDFDRMMDVNLRAMVITTKYVMPVMRAQKSGSIVNISSAAAVMAMPILAYTCSKMGVHAFTQHVAGAGGPDGIRCNCVMVGSVDNRFARGTPWDIGYASLFLHSDEARFITSVVLPVDGGATANLGMLAQPMAPPQGGLPRDF